MIELTASRASRLRVTLTTWIWKLPGTVFWQEAAGWLDGALTSDWGAA